MNELAEKYSNKFAIVACLLALVGLGDAIYLVVHSINGEQIPCGLSGGCGAVLSSQYSTIVGIPLAFFGVAAYFIAFCLALLTAFGNSKLWILFGLQVSFMVCFSAWLTYIQAYILLEYCQYCLVSAGICLSLFLVFLTSKLFKK
jgi:uncharacterized membrane protein